jgi:hypothetical protein
MPRQRYTRDDLRNAIQEQFIPAYQKTLPKWFGIIGDAQNRVYVSNRPGYIWVYRDGETSDTAQPVYNQRIQPKLHLPVIVGYPQEEPNREQVLAIDSTNIIQTDGDYGWSGYPDKVQSHAQQHQPNGKDPVYIDHGQLLDGWVRQTVPQSASIYINSMIYTDADGCRVFADGQSYEGVLSGKPSATNSALYAMLYRDPSACLQVAYGASFNRDNPVNISTAAPSVSKGIMTYAYIYLRDTDTKIAQPDIYNRYKNVYESIPWTSGSFATILSSSAYIDSIVASQVDSTTATFGTSGVSGASFNASGALSLSGEARFVDDIRVPVTSTKTGPTDAPTFTTFKSSASTGVYDYAFAGNKDEELFFTMQVPHSYASGTIFKPHVHWSKSTSCDGSVAWGLEFTFTSIGCEFGPTQTLIGAGSSTASHNHEFTSIGSISGSDIHTSAMLVGRVFRQSSASEDDYSDDAYLHEIDFHFYSDKHGTDVLY